MNGFYSNGQASVLDYIRLICGVLSILCSLFIMIRFYKRKRQELEWKELIFEEIIAFMSCALFFGVISDLTGADMMYSTTSMCLGQSLLKLLFDSMTYLIFCLLAKFSINLCISNNINELRDFDNILRQMYYSGFAGFSILYAFVLTVGTAFYVYFEAKNKYPSDSYSNLNHCQRHWVIVWRYFGYVPLLVGLIYPLIKICCTCSLNKCTNNWDWQKVPTSNGSDTNPPSINLKLRRIAMLNSLYVIVFYLCHILSGVRRFYNVFGTINNDDGSKHISITIEPIFLIACLQSGLQSSYGFFNFIVYCVIVYIVDCKDTTQLQDKKDTVQPKTRIALNDISKDSASDNNHSELELFE